MAPGVAHGVAHRDLKPANVLLTTSGQAKLSDFGLAKPHLADGGTSLTQEGIVVGTPRYMAPEAFTSDEGSSPLSDIYALGCLGIELLTGRPPFRSKDLTALIEEKERWKIPPRSANGQRMRLKAKGVPASGRRANAGDLFARLVAVLPQGASDELDALANDLSAHYGDVDVRAALAG